MIHLSKIEEFNDRIQLNGNPTTANIHTLNTLATNHPDKPLRIIWADTQGLSHLNKLTAVKLLHLDRLDNLDSLDALSGMMWLEKLKLGDLKYAHRYDLSPIFHLNLKELSIHKINDNTHDLTGINRLTALERLSLSGKFKKRSVVLNSPSLRHLSICQAWLDLSKSRYLDNLTHLGLHSGTYDNFDILHATPNLTTLNLSRIKLSGPALLIQLANLPTLGVLDIFYVKNLTDLTPLANLPIHTLKLTTLPDLISLDGIHELPHLSTLHISLYRNRYIPNLEVLFTLPKTVKITLSGDSPFCGLSEYVDEIKGRLVQEGYDCG